MDWDHPDWAIMASVVDWAIMASAVDWARALVADWARALVDILVHGALATIIKVMADIRNIRGPLLDSAKRDMRKMGDMSTRHFKVLIL